MSLVLAGFTKLNRRLASWVALGLTVGLVALLYLLLGVSANQATTQPEGSAAIKELLTFPRAYDEILGLILGFGGLVAVIYGAAVAGSEWNWGTLKTAVARGEGRSRYVILNFVPMAVLTIVVVLLAFVAGVLAAYAAAGLAGVASPGGFGTGLSTATLEKVGRVWFCLVEYEALGYAIATVARSQLAGVGVAIAIYFTTSFGELILPDVLRWFPFNAAGYAAKISSGASTGASTPVSVHALDPNVALVVVAAWLVGALVVGALVTRRAEIAG